MCYWVDAVMRMIILILSMCIYIPHSVFDVCI